MSIFVGFAFESSILSNSRRIQFEPERWFDQTLCEFSLTSNRVDVWRVPVGDHADISRLTTCLSDDEVERANRFHRDVIRFRFIKRRAALRHLLAKYQNTDAASIRFEHNEFGKPYVVDPSEGRKIQFSSSSSENLALIAFTMGDDIGCDVENCKRKVKFLSLANRFFHPDETADIHSQDERARRAAFFHCWARKEAYVKALGKGLFLPLNSFRVNTLPDKPQLIWADPKVTNAADWEMKAITPALDYVGALVVPANVTQICQFDFG